jgi:hypothetical protein
MFHIFFTFFSHFFHIFLSNFCQIFVKFLSNLWPIVPFWEHTPVSCKVYRTFWTFGSRGILAFFDILGFFGLRFSMLFL